MPLKIADHIRSIDPYVPGKPMEALEREYGISDSVKLASNENPLGPSPKAVDAIGRAVNRLHRYPDGAAFALTQKLAGHIGVDPERIVLGNGSDEILQMLARVLLSPGDEAVIPQPSFLMYEITARTAGATCVFVPLRDRRIDLAQMSKRVNERTRIVFVCNPNNPTGTVLPASQFRSFLADLPDTVAVVLDEAYIEFARDPECIRGTDFLDAGRPVIFLRTFSKAYGLAGLRVGYGVLPADLAELLHRIRMPFNVNSLAQAGALAALEDRAFLKKTVDLVHRELDGLCDALAQMGVSYHPTEANFFLIDVKKSADAVFEALLRKGVIVRSMTAYGFPTCIRVNIGAPEENRRLLDALSQVL